MVKSITYSLAIIFLLVCLPVLLSSQQTAGQAGERKSVTLRNADTVRSFDYNGRIINRLLGHVIIEQEENGVVITCDSAYMYTSDSLDLFSRIEMFQGASTIRCDKMTYDGGWARVRGSIVRMNKDNMTLLTQFFDYNIEQELGIYFNGGTVDRNGEILESDRGYYYAKPDLFMFSGNVALKNEEYTIACDTMQYSMKNEDILFLGPTKIWHGENFLSANYGWQNKSTDEVFFTDNVYLCSPDKELWSDSLYYYQAEERGLLYGNIQALDTVQSTIAFGDEGKFYNNPEFAEIYKNPAIAYYSKRNTTKQQKPESYIQDSSDSLSVQPITMIEPQPIVDTLILVADTIRSVAYPNPALYIPQDSLVANQPQDSVYRQLYAFPNVRIHRFDMQAVCDSLVFNSRDSIAKMFINPILWSDTTQVTADSMYFTMHNGVMESADFYSSPFIAMREDSIRYSQVKGRNMKAFFIESAIDRLEVYGNSQSIYYLREDYDIQNVNISESSNMTVYFRDSKVKRVKYDYDVDSKIYPIDMQPEENKALKGLKWQEDRRPKSRQELFTRRVRPSQRLETQMYKPPTFSTTLRLTELEKNSWVLERAKLMMPLVR